MDIGPDGTVYLSDASTKFRPQDLGGEMAASLLDTIEHRGHGRLLAHDPRTGKTRVLLKGLFFANGVAVSHDGRSVLVNKIAASLQSSSPRFGYTGVTETADYLFLGSIDAPVLHRLPRPSL